MLRLPGDGREGRDGGWRDLGEDKDEDGGGDALQRLARHIDLHPVYKNWLGLGAGEPSHRTAVNAGGLGGWGAAAVHDGLVAGQGRRTRKQDRSLRPPAAGASGRLSEARDAISTIVAPPSNASP